MIEVDWWVSNKEWLEYESKKMEGWWAVEWYNQSVAHANIPGEYVNEVGTSHTCAERAAKP